MLPSHQPHHGVAHLNGNGELGDDELQFRNLQRGWVTGWETYDRSPINFQPRITFPMGITGGVYTTLPDIEAGTVVPDVGSGKQYVFVMGEGFVEVFDTPTFEDSPPTDWERVSAAYEPLPVPSVPEIAVVPVIDPDYRPRETVGETSSGYPVAIEQELPVVAFWDDLGANAVSVFSDVATAWGGAQIAKSFASPAPLTTPGYPSGPGAAPYAAKAASMKVPIVQDQSLCAAPAANPRYLRYNCETGQFSKVPRRRRRRLLTSSDLKDLAALKSIVGPSKMEGAIVQAVRR